ncbi:FadR/GntR family transcriptional regulator [Lacisediminihabitans profunda]|uniref:FadR family transcriptional regulator n=1 Tax=Lacisediminihabitans profunda TaxID=2594790 RepID=A0A5C8UT61_9MICO|nr:FadR/GntR family transcriptional regulator [Lacisediminihabitans profunda]TXN31080.1 FadR family transcriptional regulator [Lacisediminihabitans profunda]
MDTPDPEFVAESAEGRTAPLRSQTDVVVHDIKDMIIRGTLVAGARLPVEKDLAASLGVSRSSLREGVRALAIMGVLETRQGDGTYVTSLDASLLLAPMGFLVDLQSSADSQHISSVRRVLEVEAAARASLLITEEQVAEAGRLLGTIDDVIDDASAHDLDAIMNVDIEFHRVIARASGNPALEALIEALASRTIRTRMWRAMTEPDVIRHTHREHHDILRAVASGDPDRARLAMSVHLIEVEDFIASHPGASTQASTRTSTDPPLRGDAPPPE